MTDMASKKTNKGAPVGNTNASKGGPHRGFSLTVRVPEDDAKLWSDAAEAQGDKSRTDYIIRVLNKDAKRVLK